MTDEMFVLLVSIGGLAIILLIIGLAVTYLRPHEQNEKAPTERPVEKPTTKLCPWCKAEIPVDAIACMHCGRQASERMMRATLLGQIGSSLLIIGLILGLGALCLMTGGFGLF